MTTEILIGDCRESLKSLPECSVHCCVTSPPYYGLRDYGCPGQIGLEKTPEEFVQKMVEVFREVKRVLREDGTCWVNLGASYAGSGGARKEHHRNPVISKSFERDGYSGGKPANQSPQQQHVPACDSDGKESQGCQDHGCACHGQCDEHPGGTQTRHGRTAHNDQCAEQGSRPSLQTGRDTGHSGCEKEPLCASPLSSQGSSENASFEGSPLYESSPHHETEPPSFGQTSACATPGFSHKERSNPYKQRRSLISAVHIEGKEPFYTACHSPSCKGLGFCGLCWCSLSIPHLNVKPKDELNIPHLVAMALQADGWVLRQTICWNKKNPMPESVTDRCTKSHEYVFLLTKSARYWYDAEAIREKHKRDWTNSGGSLYHGERFPDGSAQNRNGKTPPQLNTNGRNKRSVWTVTTTPFKGFSQTSRWEPAGPDVFSDGMKRITSPDCPAHGHLCRQDGGHEAGLTSHTGHKIHCLFELQQSEHYANSSSTDKLLLGNMLGCSGHKYFQTAILHNNGIHKTGHDLETTSPYTSCAQIPSHTVHRLKELGWSEPCLYSLLNNTSSDGLPDNLLQQILSDKTGKLEPLVCLASDIPPVDCMCSYYHKITKKASHFATFPPKLIEPMILAGCPAKCCPVCGAGWVRDIEKQSRYTKRQDRDAPPWKGPQVDSSGWQHPIINDKGFQPSCQCNAPDHVPGTVIDPFGGSGTTAYVANAYGRNAILCELNPEYKPLILERLGMPYEVEQEERKPEQMDLFQ